MMTLKEKAIYALKVLNFDDSLNEYFKKEFPRNTLGEVQNTLKIGLLSKKDQEKLTNIIPPVFEINGRLFLYGDDRRKVDYLGDDCGEDHAIELYNMTDEIDHGHSYTFYVSSVEYFKLASPEDAIKVKVFLSYLAKH